MFHVLDVFWFLLCAPLCHQYLVPYAVLSTKYYITFTASLERVQFEFVQSFPVVQALYFSDFVCKRLLNSFDSLCLLLSMDSRAGSSTLVEEWQEISRVSAWKSNFRDWNTLSTHPFLSPAFLTIFLIWKVFFYQRLSNYFSENKLLPSFQFGFRSGEHNMFYWKFQMVF